MNTYRNVPEYVYNELEKCLDRFNAHKVERIMEFLDWKWARIQDNRTPYADEIRRLARDLLISAYNESHHDNNGLGFSATGGLEAEYNRNDNTFKLVFAVESSESW